MTAEQELVLDRIAERLKALADPTRLRILHFLEDGERCVSEVVDRVGGSQANVSKHLAILRRAGLVDCRRRGLNVLYRVTDATSLSICRTICAVLSILLVDFINLELEAGERLEAAVVKAAAVRFRPIVLTAAALVVGGGVILLDPIFQGLAVALISGVLVATALTLVVIPLLYFMYVRAVGVAAVVPPADADVNEF